MIKRISIHVLLPTIIFLATLSLILQQKNISLKSIQQTNEIIPNELRATGVYQALKWYNDQRAFPTGKIPEQWRENAVKYINQHNLQKSISTTALSWTSLGPDNFGGRTRSLAINPTNTNIMYCGSVSGGIWKTTDGGTTWSPTTDNATNLAISSIVLDPNHPDTIYAATGEGYFPVDALRGAGVLKSTDGGATWTMLTNFSTPNANYSYYYINRLVIRPDNPSVLYAGMIGGIWKTTNSGTSWAKLNVGSSTISCVDLVADPLHPDTIYAAFGLFGNPTDGIYKTTNGGTNWTKLTNGLPATSTKYTRISLAVAPSNTSVIYASLSDSNYYTHSIQKSTDGGASWSAVSTPFDNAPLVNNTHLGGQGWYNNVIAVKPTDENTVYAGGINIFKSINGGTNWSRISNGYGTPYVHVDQHVITFDPSNPSTMYFGNDGGVFKSTDGGSTFSSLNNGLKTVQFYSGAVHPTSNIYYGGTQDNGTLKFNGTSWSQTITGDGGPTFVDSITPTTVYGSYVWLQVFRSFDAGANWATILNPQERSSFIAPLVMSPSNSQILVGGTYQVHRTTNGGTNWNTISGDLTGDGGGVAGDPGSTISAVGLTKTSSTTIYIGTSGSQTAVAKIQVTTNTGNVWTDVTKSPLPNRTVTSLTVDRTNASRAFATFSGYNANTSTTPGHIFLTTDKGTTWSNVSGDMPDIPTNTMVLDPVNTNHVVVGTDLGIFETTNGGTNWTQQNNGLANVAVAQLIHRTGDGILFAATHGRGMFKTTLPLAVHGTTPTIPKEFSLSQNYPNPFNPTTTIQYSITSKQYISLRVYNVIGEEVATLVNKEQSPGTYAVGFNANNLPSGVYVYRLVMGDFSEQRKMLLLK